MAAAERQPQEAMRGTRPGLLSQSCKQQIDARSFWRHTDPRCLVPLFRLGRATAAVNSGKRFSRWRRDRSNGFIWRLMKGSKSFGRNQKERQGRFSRAATPPHWRCSWLVGSGRGVAECYRNRYPIPGPRDLH